MGVLVIQYLLIDIQLMRVKMKKAILLILVAILLCVNIPLASCECKKKKGGVIFNFGDSNSDTGESGITTGFSLTNYPYGRAYFDEQTGRACDGRLIVDFLCENLNTKYLSPYLESVEPDFSSGANFAYAGAGTLPPHVPFSLGVQVRQFAHFRNRSLDLRSKGYSSKNLLGEDDFKNALYAIDIGQNDIAGAFGTSGLSYDAVISKIPKFIAEIWDAMWVIYGVGGKNFWIHNTGPLGCLPLELKANYSSSELDSNGCIRSLNAAAQVFNSNLNILCEELRNQMKDATIVYVDIYSIKYHLIANASSYGFKNPLAACCGYGGPPYNVDPTHGCGVSNFTVCAFPAISWDGVHYTEAANSIVAAKILSTNYSTPPLPIDFFC